MAIRKSERGTGITKKQVVHVTFETPEDIQAADALFARCGTSLEKRLTDIERGAASVLERASLPFAFGLYKRVNGGDWSLTTAPRHQILRRGLEFIASGAFGKQPRPATSSTIVRKATRRGPSITLGLLESSYRKTTPRSQLWNVCTLAC